MKNIVLFASLLGVSMAIQATDAAAAPAPSVKALARQHEQAAEEAAKPVASTQAAAAPAIDPQDVKDNVPDRAPQPVPPARPGEEFVNTNGNAPAAAVAPAPAPVQGHPRAIPQVGKLQNPFGVFLVGCATAGIATKLFITGLNEQKELAETAEGKLDENYKPKKKGAKDCWKSIWEKGFYVGTALVGSWFITHMLEKHAKFNLQSWLIGEDQKTADKRARMQAGHANCGSDC